MSKLRLNNATQSPSLDPFSLERSLLNITPGSNPNANVQQGQDLEFVAPKVEDGYSTFGNANLANEYIQERKAYDQDALYLAGAFAVNTLGTIATEIGKLPGYVAGGLGAVANETLGDGKNSMRLMVDNAWVNAFESLDQSIKDTMPVTLSKSVQEGNVFDKLNSGAWWATTGAEGVGFLASMFVPGAMLKAAKLGKLAAPLVEGVANAEKVLNLPMATRTTPFILGVEGQSTIDGVASMFANASLEAASEAANTFDSVKQKYLAQGLSDEEASNKAGEAASAIFKTNMVILPMTNYLDELYLFKSLGKADKSAADTVIGKLFKDGVLDTSNLNALTKITSTKNLTELFSKLAGGFAKEGFIEEGLQTITQQQVEKGSIERNPLQQLLNSISSYTNDFWNNTELHESIALGGLLGGAGGVISQIGELNTLNRVLQGGRSNENNWAVKLGVTKQKADTRGLASIITENFTNNFRSIKDLQIVDADGNTKIDEEKLQALPEQQRNLLGLHLAYDAAVASNDTVRAEQINTLLAQNYVGSFLGNPGSKELFNQHVENQLVPAWKERYAQQYGTEPSAEQQQTFRKNFKDQADLIFSSYDEAVNTNQPERYLKNDGSEKYKKFQQQYFQEKYQTLLQINTLKNLKEDVIQKLAAQGVPYFEDLNIKTVDKAKQPLVKEAQNILSEVDQLLNDFSTHYTSLFSKLGVKALYDAVDKKDTVEKESKKEIETSVESTATEIVEKDKRADVKAEAFQNDFFNSGYEEGELRSVETASGKIIKVGYDATTGTYFVETPQGSKIIEPDQIKQFELAVIPKATTEILTNLNDFDTFSDSEETSPLDETADETALVVDTNWETNNMSIVPYPTTGLHVQVDKSGSPKDKLTSDGLPLLTDSVEQQRWFAKTAEINPSEHLVKVIKLSNIETLPQVFQDQIKSNLGDTSLPTDTFVILTDLDGNVITDTDGKMYFSSLWRPETLYYELNNRFRSRLAPQAWLGTYLLSRGVDVSIKALTQKLDVLTDEDRAKLNLSSTDTLADLELTAWEYAKEDYFRWYYQDLALPNVYLPIQGKSLGYKVHRKDSEGNIIWNPIKSIVKVSNGVPVNGSFQQSYNGVITVGTKEISVPIGKTVFVNSDGYVDQLKQRFIADEETDIVLYLLSLRSLGSTLESVNIKVPVSQNGKVTTLELPVFWTKDKYSLISSLINFNTTPSNKPMSIFFSGNSIQYITKEGTLQTTPLSEIQNYVASKIESNAVIALKAFLSSKYFNINEKLLKENKKHLTMKLNRGKNGAVKFSMKQEAFTYQEYLINSDSLFTTEVDAPGYPKRLQVNLHLSQGARKILSETSARPATKPSVVIRKRDKPTLNVDKMFNPEQLLNAKLKTGEIIQQCK